MSTIEQLTPTLKRLKLSGTPQSLELRIREAVDDNLSHVEFLYRLLGDEVERRESEQLDVRLRRAAFEGAKTLDTFDFSFNPKVPKQKVIDLGTCNFMLEHDNVLLVDDLGLHPLRGEEPGNLYELIRLRYERGSMVVTSNRDVTEWYPMFGDELLASAAMENRLDSANSLAEPYAISLPEP